MEIIATLFVLLLVLVLKMIVDDLKLIKSDLGYIRGMIVQYRVERQREQEGRE